MSVRSHSARSGGSVEFDDFDVASAASGGQGVSPGASRRSSVGDGNVMAGSSVGDGNVMTGSSNPRHGMSGNSVGDGNVMTGSSNPGHGMSGNSVGDGNAMAGGDSGGGSGRRGSTASGESLFEEVDPDGSLMSTMLARQALLQELEDVDIPPMVEEVSTSEAASVDVGSDERVPASGAGGGVGSDDEEGSVGEGGTVGASSGLGDPWEVDGDDPDELEDAIAAAAAAPTDGGATGSAFEGVRRRRRRRRRRGGDGNDAGLGKSTGDMVLKELYPGVGKEMFSPQYWTHWNTEAVASREAAAVAQQSLATRKRRAAEASRAGMKGVKLDSQWRLDHPFRRPNKFGKGTGPSAFLDSDTRKCYVPPKDYLSEFRAPLPKPPLPKGGRLSQTGRAELERRENMTFNPNVGPGSYRLPSSFGKQVLGTTRSMPSFQIAGAVSNHAYKTDSPGPKYLPKRHPRIDGNTPSIVFAQSQRVPPPQSDAPGPKYNLGTTVGRTGPSFSFSVGNDSWRGKESYMNPPKTPEPPPTVEHTGFGYGCSVEEHIKYGHCLDGRCSTRSNWESIRKRHADAHARTLRSTAVVPQLAENGSVEGGDGDGGAGSVDGGASSVDGGHGSAGDGGGVAPTPLPTAGSSLARTASTAQGSTVGARSSSGRRRRRKRSPKRRRDGAPVNSSWMPVRWEPPEDIFEPFCLSCGERVAVMTRHERIMATNRALEKHAAPFVSHMATPGPKKGRLDTSGGNSARSLYSLNSIPSVRSTGSMSSLRSGSTRRSRRSRPRSRGSPRYPTSASSFSLPSSSVRSSARPPRSKLSSRRTGVSQLSHEPSSVSFVPGCGYFCDKACVRQYILANVGTGSATDAKKTKRNIKRTAVLQCVRHDNLEQLSFLLRNGSDITLLGDNRQGVLHIAAGEGHVRILDRLFCGAFNVLRFQACHRHHADDCACFNQRLDVNTLDIDGRTPLHIAAAKGQLYAIERLLASGADPEILDFQGRAAHDIAANQDCYNVLKNAVAITDFGDHLRTVRLKQYAMLRRSGKVAHTETPDLVHTGIGRHIVPPK